MKKLISLFLVSFISFGAFAQDSETKDAAVETQKEDGAKIKFETEVIDYGTIEKGADGVRKFEFTNTGNAPLIISRVYSSCGCTIPKKPEDPIAPGEKGEIEVKYDTKRVGPIRKTISVYSNADSVPFPLKIKGTITEKK
ncbi:DUF1573 domain-containing protein [Aquimarina agarivorans]|uniref:DUF1573 domain-containing protein n=1 Tax=Aquimarina agarivorans TaxID=980584 RepID=UPI000248EAC3|nr:DUF1573 domain-containing protein [Aquimarina agarivorans]